MRRSIFPTQVNQPIWRVYHSADPLHCSSMIAKEYPPPPLSTSPLHHHQDLVLTTRDQDPLSMDLHVNVCATTNRLGVLVANLLIH